MSWLPEFRVWIGWRQISDSGVLPKLAFLFLRSTLATSAWQHGTSTTNLACSLARANWIASSVAVLQAWSAVTTSMRSGRRLGGGFSDRQIEEPHPRKSSFRRARGSADQLAAGFDAVHGARVPRLQEQVVEDEAQVGLAGAVVGEGEFAASGDHFVEKRLDELVEVIDLLELAPAVLAELAVAGEDVGSLSSSTDWPSRISGCWAGLAASARRAWLGLRQPLRLVWAMPSAIQPAMPILLRGFHVALVDHLGVGEGLDGLVEAGLADQVQRGEGRAVGVVGDVVGLGALELELGWKLAIWITPLELVLGHGFVGDLVHVVEVEEVGEQRGWIRSVVSVTSGVDFGQVVELAVEILEESVDVAGALTTMRT